MAFSFIIIGCVLVWVGYRAMEGRTGPISNARLAVYFIAAACSFALGVTGIRRRHGRR